MNLSPMRCNRCGREEDPELLTDWGYCTACDKLDSEKGSDLTSEEKEEIALEYED